jgi:hypothetical protein
MSMLYYAASFVHVAYGAKLAKEGGKSNGKSGPQNGGLENWPSPSIRSVLRALDELCSLPWTQLLEYSHAHPDTDTEEKALERCQDANYAMVLLMGVLGVHPDEQRVAFTNEVKGVELEWPLGAFLEGWHRENSRGNSSAKGPDPMRSVADLDLSMLGIVIPADTLRQYLPVLPSTDTITKQVNELSGEIERAQKSMQTQLHSQIQQYPMSISRVIESWRELDGLHSKEKEVPINPNHAATERELAAQHAHKQRQAEEEKSKMKHSRWTFMSLFLTFLGLGLGTICCMFQSLRGLRLRRALGLHKRKQSKSTVDLTQLAGATMPPNSGYGLGQLSYGIGTPTKKPQRKNSQDQIVVGYSTGGGGGALRARTASFDYDEVSRMWDSPGSEVAGVGVARGSAPRIGGGLGEFGGAGGVRPRTISYDYDADRV